MTIRSQGQLQQFGRKRIKLLQPDDRHVFMPRFGAVLFKFIINFPRTKNNALDLLAGLSRSVWQNALESPRGTIFQRGSHLRMPQQAFRSHDDQRLAPGAQSLAPEAMKVLRGRRRINHLDVVLGCEMQETLESSAGMFRALPFVAVRQQQDQAAEPLPLVFGAGDELIHNRLGRIPEIAVLRLPQNEPVGIIEAIAVFES